MHAYTFDTRPPPRAAESRKGPKLAPVSVAGMYSLAVPQINVMVYKPIAFDPDPAWSNKKHLAECLKAVNVAIDAAEQQATADIAKFRKRYGNHVHTKDEQIKAYRNMMTAQALNDDRLKVGTRFGKWEVIGPARMDSTRAYPCRVIVCKCKCGTIKDDVVVSNLTSGRSKQCTKCNPPNKGAGTFNGKTA